MIEWDLSLECKDSLTYVKINQGNILHLQNGQKKNDHQLI